MKLLSSSHLLIAAVLTVLTTDAQVSLRPLNESQQNFNCGGNAILECTIESYASMTWTKDSSQLATCSLSTCDINPFISADYNFTFNTTTGIFLMEILTVKVADNGSSFSCDNGFVPATLPFYVTVENDYSCVKNSKKINSNTTEVSVTTRCIQNNAAHNVKFEWWFKEVNNTSSEKRKRNESESETIYDSSVCIADPDCGVSGYSFITNSVNITNEESGKIYRIGVDVISGATLVNSVSFDLFFILNFPVSETPDCDIEIAIPYVIIFVIVILMCIFEVMQYSNLKREVKLAALTETLEVERTKVQLQLLGLKEFHSKDERNKLKRQLADLKTTILEVEHIKLEIQKVNRLKALEADHTEIERKLEALKESRVKVQRINLERKLEAMDEPRLKAARITIKNKLVDLRDANFKAERIKLERDLVDLNEPFSEAEHIEEKNKLTAMGDAYFEAERIKLDSEIDALNGLCLKAARIKKKKKFAAMKDAHFKAERIKLKRELTALSGPCLEAKQIKLEKELDALTGPCLEVKLLWITFLCSLPFIGLLTKGILVFIRRKSVCQQCWKVPFSVLVLILVLLSMASEIFILLLWTVWCICRWYTLSLALWDLICRYVLCIIIAVLYYEDIEETNHIAKGIIALSCMPIFGLIYNLLIRILHATKRRISPYSGVCNRTNQTSQNVIT